MDTDVKLDLKDRKLLFSLDFQGRKPSSSLARDVRLSTQGTDYRIASLQKKGVITGFYPVINIGRLGCFYCRIFIKWQNLSEDKETEIYKGLASDSRINWIVTFNGAYDVAMAAYMKKLEDFKRLSEDILEHYGTYIKEKKESIGTSLVHFSNRYLIGMKETPVLTLEGAPDPTEGISLDKTDLKMLKLLSGNARMPLVSMSREIGISPQVAAYRLKRLERDKIILGYRPNIDHNRIGYVHYKLIFYLANVRRQQLQMFKSYLKTFPELLYIVEQVGVGDVDIEVMLPKDASLFAFVRKIKFYVPGIIRDYEILIADRTIKIEYVPFLKNTAPFKSV